MNKLPLIRIVHIVDSLDIVNTGVWKAAISTADQLSAMGVDTEIWHPNSQAVTLPLRVTGVPLKTLSMEELKEKMLSRQLNKATDLIITHGCWRYPTSWAAYLRNKGFTWIYTPQGMLEPWPMKHKYLKKKVYFHVKEKRLAEKATVIRAVSSPEKKNLESLFPGKTIQLIPNGVVCAPAFINTKPRNVINFVFMARLHSKKGIVHLVKAWLQSFLLSNPAYQLTIAGPDEGELPLVQSLIASASNVTYVGMVSGTVKEKLLASASYYVLPSYSEGFPTSVLEAMEKGAIPVISRGCNFNEVFTQQLGYEITPDTNNITQMLEKLAKKGNDNELQEKYIRCYNFIKDNYTLEHIASLQYELYTSLLSEN